MARIFSITSFININFFFFVAKATSRMRCS